MTDKGAIIVGVFMVLAVLLFMYLNYYDGPCYCGDQLSGCPNTPECRINQIGPHWADNITNTKGEECLKRKI